MLKIQNFISEVVGLAIGVLSGKGGVGKTTLVANLGIALTKHFNQNLIIFDGNITASHLGLHLGLYEDLPVTLADILQKGVSVSYATYIHPSTGIRLLPAPLNGLGLKLTKVGSVIKKLKKDYDLVLIDTAPGLGREVISVIKHLDKAIVITTPDLPAVTDALKSIKLLEKCGVQIVGLVVNRFTGSKYELLPSEIESTCNQKIISLVPEDKNVQESVFKGTPVTVSKPGSKAARSFKKLAANLLGVEYEPTSFIVSLKKFLGLGAERRPKITSEGIKPLVPFEKQKKVSKKKYAKEISEVHKLREELSEDMKKELKEAIMRKLKEKLGE